MTVSTMASCFSCRFIGIGFATDFLAPYQRHNAVSVAGLLG